MGALMSSNTPPGVAVDCRQSSMILLSKCRKGAVQAGLQLAGADVTLRPDRVA